jgi:hypothetical protein
MHDGEEECIQVLVEKPEGKRPLGRHRWDGMDWINLAKDRNHGELQSSCTTGDFSRRAHLHGVSYLVLTESEFY